MAKGAESKEHQTRWIRPHRPCWTTNHAKVPLHTVAPNAGNEAILLGAFKGLIVGSSNVVQVDEELGQLS